MKNSIKEILLNGGSVEFAFKENPKEWVGTAKMHIFSGGFGMTPKIIVSVPCMKVGGRKEFELSDIDNAIDLFVETVLTPDNLWYKNSEAMINCCLKGYDLDLESKADFQILETERLRLIAEETTT